MSEWGYIDSSGGIHQYGGGGGGSCLDVISIEMLIFLTIILAICYGVFNSLVDKGLIKSRVSFTLEESSEYDLDGREITIILHDYDEDREYTGTLSDNGKSCVLKVHKGTYSIYLEFEDIQICLAEEYFNGYSRGKYTITPDELFTKALLLELTDDDGTVIEVDTVSIYFSGDGSTQEAILMDNGCYALLIQADSNESGSLEIQAEGYEAVSIEYSDLLGVTKINVQLEEAS